MHDGIALIEDLRVTAATFSSISSDNPAQAKASQFFHQAVTAKLNAREFASQLVRIQRTYGPRMQDLAADANDNDGLREDESRATIYGRERLTATGVGSFSTDADTMSTPRRETASSFATRVGQSNSQETSGPLPPRLLRCFQLAQAANNIGPHFKNNLAIEPNSRRIIFDLHPSFLGLEEDDLKPRRWPEFRDHMPALERGILENKINGGLEPDRLLCCGKVTN